MFVESKTEVPEFCTDCLAISISLAAQQPIPERHVLTEKKVCFFSGGWQLREKADPCPKSKSPPLISGHVFKGEFQRHVGRG